MWEFTKVPLGIKHVLLQVSWIQNALISATFENVC